MTTNAQPNNTPITTDPFFSQFFIYLESKFTTDQVNAFLNGVLQLINDSPLLIEQINDLMGSGNWQLSVLNELNSPPNDTGETDVGSISGQGTISIYVNTAAITNNLQGAINDFVGVLAYELGHAEDLQLNTISYNGNELAVGANTALQLLSESKSVYNNILAASSIASASRQIITQGGSSSAINDETNNISNPTQAILLGAGDIASTATGVLGGGAAVISNYWDQYDSFAQSSGDTGANQTVFAALQSMTNLSNATTAFTQNANGTITMQLTNITYSSGASILFNGNPTYVSAYSDIFGNYGAVVPSGVGGGQANPVDTTPSPLGVPTSQTFDFAAGGSLVDTYNPTISILETIVDYSGLDGSGSVIWQQTDTSGANGQINADISGNGDAALLNNAAITIEDNATITIDGTSNTILVGSNDNITVTANASVQDIIQANASDSNGTPDLTTDTITFDNQSIAATNLTSGSAAQNGLTYTLSGSTLSITDSSSDSLTINNFQNGDFGVDMAPTTTVPGAQTVASGTLANISGISVNSADGSNGTITVTLSDTSGILNANVNGGGTVTGSGTNNLIISGTQDQVNVDLSTLQYVDNSTGNDSITVATSDGNGGNNTQSIAITSLNNGGGNGSGSGGSGINGYNPYNSAPPTVTFNVQITNNPITPAAWKGMLPGRLRAAA